jgi:hypothetical protein
MKKIDDLEKYIEYSVSLQKMVDKLENENYHLEMEKQYLVNAVNEKNSELNLKNIIIDTLIDENNIFKNYSDGFEQKIDEIIGWWDE